MKYEIKMEIERLNILLMGKREEYKMFGKTQEDIDADNEIINKINLLQK